MIIDRAEVLVTSTAGLEQMNLERGENLTVGRLWTVEDHLYGADPANVELYQAVAALIQSIGPVTPSVSKTTITIKGARRELAGARPTKHGVEGYLDLMRSLSGDRRIRGVAPYTKWLWVNSYRVRSLTDPDDVSRGRPRRAASECPTSGGRTRDAIPPLAAVGRRSPI